MALAAAVVPRPVVANAVGLAVTCRSMHIVACRGHCRVLPRNCDNKVKWDDKNAPGGVVNQSAGIGGTLC